MKLEGKFITELLEQLVKIPSPSGYTKEIITFCQNILQAKGLKTSVTNQGVLIATIPGRDTKNHRLLAAHVNTIGAMVKQVKNNGRLSLIKLGDYSWNSLDGEYCRIHTANDGTFTGTIQVEKAFGEGYREFGQSAGDDHNVEVRIDARVSSKEEVNGIGVQVGDFVSFEPRFTVTDEEFIKSRHLSSKAGVAVLLHLLDKIHTEQILLPHTTHFYFLINEENGRGGGITVPSELKEYVSVNMGRVGEGQTSNEFDVSICVKDSGGLYHYDLRRQLTDLAQKYWLGYQLDIYPHDKMDVSRVVSAGTDVKQSLIGPGIDASYSLERTHVNALLHTLQLLQHYIKSEMD